MCIQKKQSVAFGGEYPPLMFRLIDPMLAVTRICMHYPKGPDAKKRMIMALINNESFRNKNY